MIATTIGKTFLKAYNEAHNEGYSAEKFFIDVFHPLFYGHEKYMQWITNSPFVQGFKKGQPPTPSDRQQKLDRFLEKINEGANDASVAIGYSSTDLQATTSGQVTSALNIDISNEDVYASWIGGGLGVGVQGGFSFYFNDPKILMLIYEGWQYYRNYLEETPALRPNQIDTWNGQWLTHRLNKRFDSSDPLADFDPFSIKNNVAEVELQSWVRLVFGLSQLEDHQNILAYVFSLGQTNTTVGFIPIVTDKFQKPMKLYKKLFGENQYLKDAKTIEEIFGQDNSIRRAFGRGAIGVKALEPKLIRNLMYQSDKMPPKLKDDDEMQIVSFNTYITWLLAMLDNEKLHALAKNVVQVFMNYEADTKRAKSTKSRAVENLMKSKSADAFLNELLDVIEHASPDNIDAMEQLVGYANTLTPDNFRRFLILLKLQYTIAQKRNS